MRRVTKTGRIKLAVMFLFACLIAAAFWNGGYTTFVASARQAPTPTPQPKAEPPAEKPAAPAAKPVAAASRVEG
ncbi:MAG TPA: hypothetical protein VL501_06840, partial [Pyrinomonadaceae bacterium]|nr:hypothetical protein [Pyrinomonadaceae bacterium]